MSSGVVWYRSDASGLKLGDETVRMPAEWPDTCEYTYATTNLDVARAFAKFPFGAPRDHERWIYRVELCDPIDRDPDFRSDENAWFGMSHCGIVREVVEKQVTMTIDEARQVLSTYVHSRLDGSPLFDGDGYAAVPPEWRDDNRFGNDEIRTVLRTLDTYPDRRDVMTLLNELFPLTRVTPRSTAAER